MLRFLTEGNCLPEVVRRQKNDQNEVTCGKIHVDGKCYFKKKIERHRFSSNEVKSQAELCNTDIGPRLYEVFLLSRGEAILLMELLKGKTIDHILEHIYFEDDLNLVAPFALSVLQHGLEVLSILHSKNWSHNDIHGNNIMLLKVHGGEVFQLKLIDFELATKGDGFHKDFADLYELFKSIIRRYKKKLLEISPGHKSALEKVEKELPGDEKALRRVEKERPQLNQEGILQLVKETLLELDKDYKGIASLKTRLRDFLFPEESGDESTNEDLLSVNLRGNENQHFSMGTTSTIDDSISEFRALSIGTTSNMDDSPE